MGAESAVGETVVYSSDTLEWNAWTEVNVSEADISVEDAEDVEIVTLRHPLDGGAEELAEFFRLVVERDE